MDERILAITPRCGLCNRMRCVLSGIQLGIDMSFDRILVNWQVVDTCAARFSDMFMPIHIGNVRVLDNDRDLRISQWHANRHIPRIERWLRGWHQIYNHNIATCGDITPRIGNARKVYLQSYHSMHAHADVNTVFVPLPALMERIDSESSTFSPNTYGVHIRRTDHVKSTQKSSTDKFEALMRRLVQDEDASFYLATDDHSLKKYFSSIFPGRIFSTDIPLERDTVEGMRGAVIDLWLLSRTKGIYGSYFSSYSEMAAEIGGITLQIIE